MYLCVCVWVGEGGAAFVCGVFVCVLARANVWTLPNIHINIHIKSEWLVN